MAVRTTNISRGGFLCLTNAPLELGTVVDARIQLTPHEALDCMAQVVRVDEPAERGAITANVVALRFMDLVRDSERKLARALAALGEDADEAGVPDAYRSSEAKATR
jgi:hypothetical protein